MISAIAAADRGWHVVGNLDNPSLTDILLLVMEVLMELLVRQRV